MNLNEFVIKRYSLQTERAAPFTTASSFGPPFKDLWLVFRIEKSRPSTTKKSTYC